MHKITYVLTATQARSEVTLQLGRFDRVYTTELDSGRFGRCGRIDRIHWDGVFGID
jgi:hypothetical protein